MSNPTNQPKLCLLMTGSELMSGDTIDSNSAYLGKKLADIGLSITEKITVSDDAAILLQQIQRLSVEYDVIFMNGGLGPTQDDLTAEVLARACQCELAVNREAEQHVISWCEKRGLTVNAANLKQAILPNNATIFSDAPGSAAAFYLRFNRAIIIATPGVPSELRTITEKDILPFLQQRFPLKKTATWLQYQLFGIGESSLQQLIDEQFPSLSDYFTVGFRANSPYVELKLLALPTDNIAAQNIVLEALLAHLQENIIGSAHSTVASSLINALENHNKTVSSAESCTGGMIASLITQIAGSSAVFPGSIISYSNDVKKSLLQVSEHTLEQQGAVSEATVRAMLNGVLAVIKSDYAMAVSGIAGPSGGSDEKPVGTVWIAFGSKQQQQAICLVIRQPRVEFQQLVSTIAMDLLRRQILGFSLTPRYLSRWQKN